MDRALPEESHNHEVAHKGGDHINVLYDEQVCRGEQRKPVAPIARVRDGEIVDPVADPVDNRL
jgi:hypothetical protein